MHQSKTWRQVFLERVRPDLPDLRHHNPHWLLMNTSYKLLDEPDQGCAKGKILDSDEDHNLFAEFGLYYKAPPLAPPTPPFTLPADAQLTRLVPAPDDTDEAALNVAAAAAADPAAAVPGSWERSGMRGSEIRLPDTIGGHFSHLKWVVFVWKFE